ncbi:MAG: hypothetical protein ABEJ92_10060 [Halobacteriales archaeon]
MDRSGLAAVVGRYGGLYAGVTVVAVFLGSPAFGYAFGNAALLMLLGSLIVAPLMFSTSDVGLDTARRGGVVGFTTITDPRKYPPEGVPIPNKAQFGAYLSGLAAFSALGLVLIVAT